jgi:hypothetical protein
MFTTNSLTPIFSFSPVTSLILKIMATTFFIVYMFALLYSLQEGFFKNWVIVQQKLA